MTPKVNLKDNIIYFDLGNLRVGDIDTIISETLLLLDDLSSPFYSISSLDTMIENRTLIHPEDFEKFKDLGALLNQQGRQMSLWVVPESSILYATSLATIPPGGTVRRVDTIEEAEELIEQLRLSGTLR